jgi:hypothetical protein
MRDGVARSARIGGSTISQVLAAMAIPLNRPNAQNGTLEIFMGYALMLAAALALAGCATMQDPPQVVDTYCIVTKKRSWSVEDSAESIRAAVAINKAIDKRCGVPKS